MNRIARGALLATALLLLLAPSALAWPDDATVQLSSTPAGTTVGQPWDVDISFVSSGQLMTANLQPVVVIREQSTGREQSFAAEPTARTGIYRARVVFPSEGDWAYTVIAHRGGASFDFPSYRIGPMPGAVPTAASTPTGTTAVYLAGLALIAALAVGLNRRLTRRSAAR
jgi:hypothetical protein